MKGLPRRFQDNKGDEHYEILQAFRLVGGPCDGEIAEMPASGYAETWRFVHGSGDVYARYERPQGFADDRRATVGRIAGRELDERVFVFTGETTTRLELARRIGEQGGTATLHGDHDEYER
jgi:hypothetical protein